MNVIAGDCRSADARLYDVMITDPPYSAHVHKNTTSCSPGRGTRHNELGFGSLSDELRDVIGAFTGQVKRWSIIYSDIEGLSGWRYSATGTYIRAMPWVRWSSPQLSGDRPPQGFELVNAFWGSQKGRKSWNGPGNLTHLAHKCLRGEGKHKAEKPLDQALDLVTWFTNPGEHIFDPCAGSGTVGVACQLLGREYTGYELDEAWAEKANNRLIDPMSDRDSERYERWLVSHEAEVAEMARCAANTAKTRAKMDLGGVIT